MEETITITELEYRNLLLYKEQIEPLSEVVNRLDVDEIDGFDFGDEVLNIL